MPVQLMYRKVQKVTRDRC